jgi:beta-galactosidase GanA
MCLSSAPQTTPYERVRGSPYNVSYDSRALLVNGERVLLQSGSVHYPRAPPPMWPGIIAQAKAHGLNMIQVRGRMSKAQDSSRILMKISEMRFRSQITLLLLHCSVTQMYVFWNYHEIRLGEYDFSTEGKDLGAFIQAVADAGLFVHLRLGPYACAEWNYGGIPVWMKFQPNVTFRTDNEAWYLRSEKFVQVVLNLVEPHLARNGGPIVLAQIENEYGNVEGFYGSAGYQYMLNTAKFALAQNIGVPWVMCVQTDAPQDIINTCNGFYCDQWISGHVARNPTQPNFWTEAWNGESQR